MHNNNISNNNIKSAQQELTSQQQAVVDSTEKYILVASCPGSGKSFTLKHMNPNNKSRDLKLSFARADAAALQDDSKDNKSAKTMDSLGWNTISEYENNCSVLNEKDFLTDEELHRFAGIFYEGGWDELTEAIKPLNGNSKRNIVGKLIDIYTDYESTGTLPTSGRTAVLAANQYVEYLRKYIRNYSHISAILDFADSQALDVFKKLESKLLKKTLPSGKLTENQFVSAYICYMLGITGKQHNKKSFNLVVNKKKMTQKNQKLIVRMTEYIDCQHLINGMINNLNEAGWRNLFTNYWTSAKAFNTDTGWNPKSTDDREKFKMDCLRIIMGFNPLNKKMNKVFNDVNKQVWKLKLNHPDYMKIDPVSKNTVALDLTNQSDKETFYKTASAAYGKTYLIGEISVEFKNLIENDKNLVKPLLKDYDRILVDEGQDLSEVQADIINEFANQSDVRICIFYDGDQSMYGFRNAAGDLANRTGFLTNSKATRVVMHLSDNFRSTNEIIDLANSIRTHIANSSGSTIIAARNSTSPEMPALRSYASDKDEAAGIIQWISDIAASNTPLAPTPMRDIAIICRTGYMVKYIAAAINAYGATHETELFNDERWNKDAKRYESILTTLSVRTENGTGVHVITAHKSKGRQYDAVWIAGLEKDLWPLKHDKGQQRLSTREYQEELRTFYVAVTRAKNRLVMSYAGTRNPMNVTSDGKTDRPEVQKPSSFLPTSKVNTQYQVFPMTLVNYKKVTESIFLSKNKMDANTEFLLRKFSSAKWGNRKIQDAFQEKINELQTTIDNMRANNGNEDKIAELEDEQASFVKRLNRIRKCADAVKVGVFSNAQYQFSYEAVTNYNRCRERWCELDQNMYSSENAERLANAISLIDAAGNRQSKAKMVFGKTVADLDINDRDIVPEKSLHSRVKLAKNSARKKYGDDDGYAKKGMEEHHNYIFLTVTLPFNYNLNTINKPVTNKKGNLVYKPIQQLIHAMVLALHPTRGTDWSKSCVNGFWLTTEITVKSETRTRPDGKIEPDPVKGATQKPECHLHCHILLDMTHAYTGGHYRKTINNKVEHDVENFMIQGKKGDDMAWHLRRSMISAGIPFKQGQLPIVRMEAIGKNEKYSSCSDTLTGYTSDGETGRTIYQEITKYATKASFIYPTPENEHPVWNSDDEITPYVDKAYRDESVYTLAEAEKGLRLQRAYGTIKDALKSVDKFKQKISNPQAALYEKTYEYNEQYNQYKLIQDDLNTTKKISQSSIAVNPNALVDPADIEDDSIDPTLPPDDNYDPFRVPDEPADITSNSDATTDFDSNAGIPVDKPASSDADIDSDDADDMAALMDAGAFD